MTLLVADISLLFDLERGSFVDAAFQLDFDFTISDLLYEAELKPHQGQRLENLGLRVEELDSDGVKLAQCYFGNNLALTISDCFALALASRNDWALLTGDIVLHEQASNENVTSYGFLWLLDQIDEQEMASPESLRNGLVKVAGHPGCRISEQEILTRLQSYERRV